MPVDILKESEIPMHVRDDVKLICGQVIDKFFPSKIILFGSHVKGTARLSSDIDICIIKDTDDKRKLLTQMYVEIESNKPFDILVYTEAEWAKLIDDTTTFAYLIHSKGVLIYG